MKIEILYFEGCPSHGPTVELVEEIVERLAVDADLVQVEVPNQERAAVLGFLGSPSVRIDGRDIEPDAAPPAKGGAIGCRLYKTADGLRGVPPSQLLEAAIRGASAS